ncbi:CBD9-like protein [Lindgomyces ingoldianus]|uniref:CBD9-like protein n=1 Tax=Lindgomyces ingoldianus TaxID=673940 RepID=A0ACB6RBZ1_9PLEO|nr:CBD9-like protein [Lindgomyces ingoldianus]KAF2476612.1 CBD9-like protein [Lindgomyces ingoldianus]
MVLTLGSALGRPSTSAVAEGAVAFYDAETGFTFSQFSAAYSLGASITYRIAVPTSATNSAPYDVVLQVVAPKVVGWAGLAWGGSMVKNPLTVTWANGNTPVISSRWAAGHTMPTSYSDAIYTIFKTGTKSNSTHWQFTARCTGCTAFQGANGYQVLNPKSSNRLAFAYSATKPSNPGSPDSGFVVHDVHNYWSHDFSSGANADFTNLVQKNMK